jgi:phosphate:Na+ symporter
MTQMKNKLHVSTGIRTLDEVRKLEPTPVLVVLALCMFFVSSAFAASDTQAVNWATMVISLLGGLAIFLYGMEKMTEALRAVAGERMKNILAKLTTNRFAGVATGAGVTAVVQSSSVTTVIVVGFVTAGLMNLTQSLGVIFGANIGTTITAQIVAFKVTKYALLMVAVGFGMLFLSRREIIKNYGAMLMGLGLVFFGMAVMGDAMKPLRSYQPFLDLMVSMENPFVGILVAALFTGLVQSSSATTSIVIVMAGQGFITLPAGIALAYGANIGTCVTAMLAAIGKPREAVQAAVAHLLFNIFGVLLWVAFVPQLAQFVTYISPVTDTGLTGAAKLGAEAPRQIANAHTIFNVVNTLIFLPFLTQFAVLVEKLVPLKEITPEEAAIARFKPKYLDEGMLNTPPLALSMARREIRRMGEVVEEMIAGLPQSVFAGNVDKMTQIREKDDQVDALYAAISRYLTLIGRKHLSTHSSDEALELVTASSEVENIGDIIEIHMSHLTSMCQSSGTVFSDDEMLSLKTYHKKVLDAFKSALAALEHDRRETAEMVLEMSEDVIGGMDKLVMERQSNFLGEEHTPQEMVAFTLQNDILENLKRIYEHTARIAKLVTGRGASMMMVATE